MITRATPDDIPHMVGLAAKHHAASGAPGEFSAPEMQEYLVAFFKMQSAAFISRGGMIFGFVHPLYYDPAYLMALEIDWFADDGAGMALLDCFEAWARRQGARELRMSSMTGHRGAAVNRLLRSRGYEAHETSLRKVMS